MVFNMKVLNCKEFYECLFGLRKWHRVDWDKVRKIIDEY